MIGDSSYSNCTSISYKNVVVIIQLCCFTSLLSPTSIVLWNGKVRPRENSPMCDWNYQDLYHEPSELKGLQERMG